MGIAVRYMMIGVRLLLWWDISKASAPHWVGRSSDQTLWSVQLSGCVLFTARACEPVIKAALSSVKNGWEMLLDGTVEQNYWNYI